MFLQSLSSYSPHIRGIPVFDWLTQSSNSLDLASPTSTSPLLIAACPGHIAVVHNGSTLVLFDAVPPSAGAWRHSDDLRLARAIRLAPRAPEGQTKRRGGEEADDESASLEGVLCVDLASRIVSVAFHPSADSLLLLTVTESGSIRVWKWRGRWEDIGNALLDPPRAADAVWIPSSKTFVWWSHSDEQQVTLWPLRVASLDIGKAPQGPGWAGRRIPGLLLSESPSTVLFSVKALNDWKPCFVSISDAIWSTLPGASRRLVLVRPSNHHCYTLDLQEQCALIGLDASGQSAIALDVTGGVWRLHSDTVSAHPLCRIHCSQPQAIVLHRQWIVMVQPGMVKLFHAIDGVPVLEMKEQCQWMRSWGGDGSGGGVVVWGVSGVWFLQSKRVTEGAQLVAAGVASDQGQWGWAGDEKARGLLAAAVHCREWGQWRAEGGYLLELVRHPSASPAAIHHARARLLGQLATPTIVLAVGQLSEQPNDSVMDEEEAKTLLTGFLDASDFQSSGPLSERVAPLACAHIDQSSPVDQSTLGLESGQQTFSLPSPEDIPTMRRAELELVCRTRPDAMFTCLVSALGVSVDNDQVSLDPRGLGTTIAAAIYSEEASTVSFFELFCEVCYRVQPSILVSFVNAVLDGQPGKSVFKIALASIPPDVAVNSTDERMLARAQLMCGCGQVADGVRLLLRGSMWGAAVKLAQEAPENDWQRAEIFDSLLVEAASRHGPRNVSVDDVWRFMPRSYRVADLLDLLEEVLPEAGLIGGDGCLSVGELSSQLVRMLRREE